LGRHRIGIGKPHHLFHKKPKHTRKFSKKSCNKKNELCIPLIFLFASSPVVGTAIELLAVGNCYLLKEEQDQALAKNYEGTFALD